MLYWEYGSSFRPTLQWKRKSFQLPQLWWHKYTQNEEITVRRAGATGEHTEKSKGCQRTQLKFAEFCDKYRVRFWTSMKFELINQLLVSFNKYALVACLNCWFFMQELQLCSACGLFVSAAWEGESLAFWAVSYNITVERVSSVRCNWDPLEMEKIQSVTRIYSYWWCVFSWHQHQGFTLQVPWLWSLGTGSAEGKCFPAERVALLGAPPDPWVCHLEALRSKMSDNQVKCREVFFTCKWHCSQEARTFLKFMLGMAWWKCSYVFITGGD